MSTDKKNVAPDCELFAESLTSAQQLFFITVWNEGGMMGVNELILFISDAYMRTDPVSRKAYAIQAADQFFSEKAFDEFQRNNGVRDRMAREAETQEKEGGSNNGDSGEGLIYNTQGGKYKRGQG